MTSIGKLAWFAVLILSFGSCLGAQDVPVLDEAIRLLHFEPLTYPLSARLMRTQGTVVVRVKLDHEGRVLSSTAVSGAKHLIPDCLANSKQWLFKTNTERAAVIVYHFRIEGVCKLPCLSQFLFRPPNFATITIGDPVLEVFDK